MIETYGGFGGIPEKEPQGHTVVCRDDTDKQTLRQLADKMK